MSYQQEQQKAEAASQLYAQALAGILRPLQQVMDGADQSAVPKKQKKDEGLTLG